MIELDRKRTTPVSAEERGLTPAERARRDVDARLESVMSIPVLKPIPQDPQSFTANNRTPREIIETVCKLFGVNVIIDSDPAVTSTFPKSPTSVQFNNASLEEILNYVAMQQKLYWKPISANAVFVTVDNPNKRREVEEQVTRIFYIKNVSDPADLNELRTTITQLFTLTRPIAVSASQNALIMRGTADQVALAEMVIRDLDRAKPEVVVDVIVMEANRDRSRSLSAALGSGSGINIPITYSPRAAVTGGGTGATGGTRLNNIAQTSTSDFQVTLPGALLQAFMNDSGARILQSPQVRAVNGKKASLKVGDKVPYSSGGMQPTTGVIGTTSLYNSFQFLDTGVTVDITPWVQGSDEVAMHVEITISSVKDRIDIGGISQPEVVNRNIINDIRLREGEVNLLGGLVTTNDTKSVAGVPGLSSIPILKRLFSTESINKSDNELLIAIIPRIVRGPDLDDLSFKGIAVGGGESTKLTYAPKRAAAIPPAAPVAAAPAAAAPAITTLPAAAPAATPAPAAPARVAFTPGLVTAASGGTVTVSLGVENVTDLYSAPLRFKFDPNVLRLDDVTRGGFLSGDGRDVLFTRNIQNSTGDVTINLRRNTGVGGLSGSGTLVTMTFQVIGKGVTTVTAPGLSFTDSRGQAVLTASPQMNVTIK
jgi:general secretion pathway protein D